MALDKTTVSDNAPIELDKLEIPTLSLKSRPVQEPRRTFERKPKAVAKSAPKKNRGVILKLFFVIAVLIIAATSILIYERKELSFSFHSDKGPTLPANYLRVGPITATIANNDIVKLTVEIDCKNSEFKNKMSRMDSLIRDKIVNVLTQPDTQKLIKSNNYDAIRTRMKKDLGALMPDEAIEDIYFSEFLTY